MQANSRSSPSRSSRSAIVFTVVAVVALGSTLATEGAGGGAQGHPRDASAQGKAERVEPRMVRSSGQRHTTAARRL